MAEQLNQQRHRQDLTAMFSEVLVKREFSLWLELLNYWKLHLQPSANAVKAFKTIMMYFDVDGASRFAIVHWTIIIETWSFTYGKLSPRRF